MKKYLALSLLLFSCTADTIDYELPSEVLSIGQDQGIKLESYVVTEAVSINLKVNQNGYYSVLIKNISGSVVSKERISLSSGDNIHKVYVGVLPVSSYSVELVDEDYKLIGTEVFSMQNK